MEPMKIGDNDGKLHLYIYAAFKGRKWGGRVSFDEDKKTFEYFKQQGTAFIEATARTLLEGKIISE